MNVMWILIIASISAFIILLLKKWGATEWMQRRGSRIISQLANCDLCLSFWAGVIVSVVAFAFTGDWGYVAAPIVTTPITRILL